MFPGCVPKQVPLFDGEAVIIISRVFVILVWAQVISCQVLVGAGFVQEELFIGIPSFHFVV
jgi:hypothetical protein